MTEKANRFLAATGAALLFAAAAPANADTLSYNGAWFSSYTSGGFTIQDASPLLSPIAVYAGAFKMTDTSGPTLVAGSSFMAWCVDIYHDLASSSAYTLQAGSSYFSGAPGTVSDLDRLASYVFDQNLLTNNVQSAAFQLAVWEIVNDKAGTGFYDVTSGDFKVTSGNTTAITTANSWLAVVNAGQYAVDRALGVWQVDIAGSSQNLGVFSAVTPVPEPKTYAMLLAGLGLMGFVAVRRRGSRYIPPQA